MRNWNRRGFLVSSSATFVSAALTLPFSTAPVQAQQANLMFGTTNGPQVPVNRQIMHPWAKRINEQGNGVVAIDVRDGPTLANFNNYYDRVISNAVQISWGIQAYIAGKFAASLAPGLPFTSDKAEDASVAYWRLLKSGILDSEYTDIETLFVCVSAQASLHTKRPVEHVDDLRGMKIATGNPVVADLVIRMKGVPVSLVVTEYYEALQRGNVDGAVTPWSTILTFKLHEVLHHHIDLPLGANTSALFMARKRFAELTPAARKVLVDNSGEAESQRFGAFWDNEDDRGRNAVKAIAGHTIASASQEQMTRLKELAQPVKQAWAAKTPNGAKVLDTYENILAEVRR